ncbi:DUF134 domain-containing protein [Sulfurospirillum barnesii]|uniref:UPF0251 protein Sulba_0212 n=1 Tax=Sulfurospirillum barnesii (strain ATCC 700032 / DSM 10660 / SES-3) TaxID=760154 RepID=I3XUB5_SULBS|nr:DUF134 domain-containing protein [Sulfurospirillum barnesii]AFL67539.1 putative DNA-binding protein [Sulfurospirillum barnesii SES-3]
MARNPKARAVSHPPLFTTFKPAGVAATKLATITLELDEYEAIRLADYEGLEHEEAAEMMGISRSTFTRLIERARKKMALMLVEGSKVVIDGGSVHFKENVYQCKACNHRFRARIHEEEKECPLCHSSELIDFAKGFGHGSCCHHTEEEGA